MKARIRESNSIIEGFKLINIKDGSSNTFITFDGRVFKNEELDFNYDKIT